ncbi:acyl-CoA desaturase [Nocardia sp. NPDC023852]|uniref:fatty acid desaturase family protein n=1 Tax=Nocardia sp. NPDC023852 TaxID=3154697 RepID=UPI0033CFE6E3
MAINDIKTFAHLAESDIETFAAELDTVRRDVERSLGVRDAAYVTRVIRAQRILEVAARSMLFASGRRPAWLAGTAILAVAKIIEMMELGHNISHGQWDWMNDPEIHSSSWEWDFASPSSQWKKTHNHIHHTYTNVYGMDDDLGFAVLRMTRDEPWRPVHLAQPAMAVGIAAFFEWAIAVHDWAVTRRVSGTPDRHLLSTPTRELARKFGRQIGKDLLIFPALTGRHFRHTLSANAAALLVRNLWSFVVIMCGHFPDGAEKFTPGELAGETRGQWYLRQLLGTANFKAGPVLAFMSGNLCYQIEHHLFPDLPSNRYAEIAERVRALCDKYDIPYTTGSLPKQFWLTSRTICKLALPDRFLRRTSDDAPETSSERKFLTVSLASTRDASDWHGSDLITGERRGLRTALAAARSSQRKAAQDRSGWRWIKSVVGTH